VSSGATDMVGVARAMVLDPQLPESWLTEKSHDPDFPRFTSTTLGGVTAWYTMRMTALAKDEEDMFLLDLPTALRTYEERDAQRSILWQKKFLCTAL